MNNNKPLYHLSLSVLLSVVFSILLLSACRKDPALQNDKVLLPGENCAVGLEKYTAPSTWPQLNWECPSCINGCEYYRSTRPVSNSNPVFNQSNPYQIAFLRYNRLTYTDTTFLFDFCTGKLTPYPNLSLIADIGTDNTLYFINQSGYLCTMKPNGDSLFQSNDNKSSGRMQQFLSPNNHYLAEIGPYTYQTRDIHDNKYYTTTIPIRYDKLTWVNDYTIAFVMHSSKGDSLFTLDLRSSATQFLTFISDGRTDTVLGVNDSTVRRMCYNPNNQSLYWTSNYYIMKYDMLTKTKSVVRECHFSLNFLDMDYSPRLRKFLLEGVESSRFSPCDGARDVSIYMMNEDGSDLRRIEFPE